MGAGLPALEGQRSGDSRKRGSSLMNTTYAWADHRILEAAATPGGKSVLFGADQASLFEIGRAHV